MNWQYDPVRDPLDRNFCARLEYALSQALGRSDDPRLKGFYCDGIAPPGEPPHSGWQTTSEHLIIRTRAFSGKTGQEEYYLTLLLGPISRSSYLNGEVPFGDIPKPDANKWFTIDPDQRLIEVFLD